MVLKPLGEKIVNILVNGTQEASYTQTQTDRDYDVSISTSGSLSNDVLWSYSNTFDTDTSDTIYLHSSTSQSITHTCTVSGDITATSDGGDSYIRVYVNGTQIASASTSTSTDDNTTFSQQFNQIDNIYFEYKDGNSGAGDQYINDITLEFDPSITTSYSVTGVTQSN